MKKQVILICLIIPGFIFTLAAGPMPDQPGPQADFNHDLYADLAIGVPYDSPGGVMEAGGVNVIYGTNVGLFPFVSDHWHQDQPNTEDSAEILEHFGRALTVGDFDGDGYYDLAVGVPIQTVNGHGGAGAVHVFYGSEKASPLTEMKSGIKTPVDSQRQLKLAIGLAGH